MLIYPRGITRDTAQMLAKIASGKKKSRTLAEQTTLTLQVGRSSALFYWVNECGARCPKNKSCSCCCCGTETRKNIALLWPLLLLLFYCVGGAQYAEMLDKSQITLAESKQVSAAPCRGDTKFTLKKTETCILPKPTNYCKATESIQLIFGRAQNAGQNASKKKSLARLQHAERLTDTHTSTPPPRPPAQLHPYAYHRRPLLKTPFCPWCCYRHWRHQCP